MLVKPDAPAPKTIDVTVWRRAIPQFNIHHLDDVQVGADLALLHASPVSAVSSSFCFLCKQLCAALSDKASAACRLASL